MKRSTLGNRKRHAAPPKPPTSRPIVDLLNERPFRILSASISDRTAVLILAHPLPPVGPIVRDAIIDEVHRLARHDALNRGVGAVEVWAPVAPQRPHAIVYRESLDKPLRLSPRPLGNAQSAMRGYLMSGGPAASRPRASHRPGSPTGTAVGLDDLFIPAALRPQLEDQPVDSSAGLTGFVVRALQDAGFSRRTLAVRPEWNDVEASIEGAKVFVRCYHGEKKVPRAMIDRFGYDFLRSHHDEALFVSDGFIPYDTRHWERNRKIHLIGWLGLQRFINAVAARHLRRDSEKAG